MPRLPRGRHLSQFGCVSPPLYKRGVQRARQWVLVSRRLFAADAAFRPVVIALAPSKKKSGALPLYLMISSMHTKSVPMTQLQLSTVSFLPSEILIHIFQHGIDEAPHSAHALPRPFTLAGVCRSWRAVVLRAPELWTHVFVTSATTVDHFQACLDRSGHFEIHASFCNWIVPQDGGRGVICYVKKAFSIVSALCRHAHRLRTLSLWDVSDAVVCTVINGLLNIQTPRLTTVSVRANQTAYTHYYQLRNPYLLPFLSGRAPSLTRLEIDHFPIETLHKRSDWPFANVQNLTSLTLRTQECPTVGYSLPPYLIEFPALCALLQSTPNLVSLALHGPIIEPDEDFPVHPPRVTLPALETLIVHRRDPGIRYHCELLSTLSAPALKRLEIPWHDDLSVELPHADRARAYLFQDQDDNDNNGGGSRPLRPRFASVRELYVHDSAVERQMPARSFIEAFPGVEEVVLGGTDVASFAEALQQSVRPRRAGTGSFLVGPCPDDDEFDDYASADATASGGRCPRLPESEFRNCSLQDELEGNAWQAVKKVVLKEPEVEMAKWKGWVGGFCKWLAAEGHVSGEVCVEIQDLKFLTTMASKDGKFDDGGMRAFKRGLDRLRRYAQVVVV